MITAQDIGALAMIEKLTRIWLPPELPKENIWAGFDGHWHKDLHEDRIARFMNLHTHIRDEGQREAYLRRTYKFRADSYFRFSANRGDNTCFAYTERFNFWQFFSTEPFPSDEQEPGYKFYGFMGCLSFDDDYGFFRADVRESPETSFSSGKRAEFSKKWLTFFRRNCWLCGCDIECSRAERLAWLEGLTPQEIEEWQLKA